MYDSVYIEVTCPACKEKQLMECQTKDGKNGLHNYTVGDSFPSVLFDLIKNKKIHKKFIDTLGSCHSYQCKIASAKNSIKERGYFGGFTRTIRVKVYLNKQGKITSKHKIIDYDDFPIDVKDWEKGLKLEDIFRLKLVREYLPDQEYAVVYLHEFTYIVFERCLEDLQNEGFDDEEIKSIFWSNDMEEIKEVLIK